MQAATNKGYPPQQPAGQQLYQKESRYSTVYSFQACLVAIVHFALAREMPQANPAYAK